MQCRELKRYLYAYVDSELKLETTLDLVHHLLLCPQCRAKFEQEERLCQIIKLSEQHRRMPKALRQALNKLRSDLLRLPKKYGPGCC